MAGIPQYNSVQRFGIFPPFVDSTVNTFGDLAVIVASGTAWPLMLVGCIADGLYYKLELNGTTWTEFGTSSGASLLGSNYFGYTPLILDPDGKYSTRNTDIVNIFTFGDGLLSDGLGSLSAKLNSVDTLFIALKVDPDGELATPIDELNSKLSFVPLIGSNILDGDFRFSNTSIIDTTLPTTGILNIGTVYAETINVGNANSEIHFATGSIIIFPGVAPDINISIGGGFSGIEFDLNGGLYSLSISPNGIYASTIGKNVSIDVDNGFSHTTLAGRSVIINDTSIRFNTPTFYTEFLYVQPTANRTITFQDGTGTVAFLSDISGGGGGTVTNVSGTTNRITVATGTTTPVIDISGTFEALLGKVASPLSQFASTTSAQLFGVISDKAGTGSLVFNTSPTFVGTVVLPTGSTSAVPITLISGALKTTPVVGGLEFLTDNLFFTITTGVFRRTVAFLESTQTFTAPQTFTNSITFPSSFTIDSTGVGIGTPSTVTKFLNVAKTFTTNIAQSYVGVSNVTTYTPASNSGTGFVGYGTINSSIQAANALVYCVIGGYGNASNSNLNTTTSVIGSMGTSGSSLSVAGTSTVTNNLSTYSFGANFNAGATSNAVLTNNYSFYGGISKNYGTGTLTGTNSYVFYSESSAGSTSIDLRSGVSYPVGSFTNNFSYYSAGGANAFLGTIAIGLASNIVASSKLHIGAGSATANTAPLQINTGTVETTIRSGLLEYNNGWYLSTNSLNRVGVGGKVFNNFSDIGNVTTTETDLDTYTFKTNSLDSNGASIEVSYSGKFVSSGTATRQIKVYFGGTAIFDTGALTLSLSSTWTTSVNIIRVSSTIIRYAVSLLTEGAALSAYTASGELTGLTLSNTNILKVTGTAAGAGAATNDIVLNMSLGKLFPASNN